MQRALRRHHELGLQQLVSAPAIGCAVLITVGACAVCAFLEDEARLHVDTAACCFLADLVLCHALHEGKRQVAQLATGISCIMPDLDSGCTIMGQQMLEINHCLDSAVALLECLAHQLNCTDGNMLTHKVRIVLASERAISSCDRQSLADGTQQTPCPTLRQMAVVIRRTITSRVSIDRRPGLRDKSAHTLVVWNRSNRNIYMANGVQVIFVGVDDGRRRFRPTLTCWCCDDDTCRACHCSVVCTPQVCAARRDLAVEPEHCGLVCRQVQLAAMQGLAASLAGLVATVAWRLDNVETAQYTRDGNSAAASRCGCWSHSVAADLVGADTSARCERSAAHCEWLQDRLKCK